MSHFSVAVLLPADTTDVKAGVTALLAPYDENTRVPAYPVTIPPDEVEYARAFYAKHANEEWGETVDPTDEVGIARILGKYHEADIGRNEDGWYYLSTYNPASKWDWWEIGGRWHGWLEGVESHPNTLASRHPSARTLARNWMPVHAIKPGISFFAVVTPDGEWHAKGRMGWWAAVHEAKEQERWDAERSELLSAFPNHLCVVVDCHI